MNYTTPTDTRRPTRHRPDAKEFTQYLLEIENQPAWRARADREMDYVDGNQLDAEVLQRQKALGMPPAIEPLIGPRLRRCLDFRQTRTTGA